MLAEVEGLICDDEGLVMVRICPEEVSLGSVPMPHYAFNQPGMDVDSLIS